ncbi:ORF1 [Banana streak GF virus]|uniref:ORF1 n=1 Tax=Banana streak GF virus TaxID=328670 RepID=Q6RSW9_9VIRU|nr:ORF1 [Banana streak GF virus]AAR86690.1 ORF1 [Banana streak GF virus]
MNSDLKEFENQFLSWRNSWQNWKDLDYLNLESSSRADLAHNLRITAYRVDLGNKALFALSKQNCLHTLDLRTKLQEQELQLQEIGKLSKIVRQQRNDLKLLLSKQDHLQEEILQLRQDYLKRRPLSKEDVEELVIKISEQPKFIEKQTEALTEELAKKVDKVEEPIHHLRKTILG